MQKKSKPYQKKVHVVNKYYICNLQLLIEDICVRFHVKRGLEVISTNLFVDARNWNIRYVHLYEEKPDKKELQDQ